MCSYRAFIKIRRGWAKEPYLNAVGRTETLERIAILERCFSSGTDLTGVLAYG